MILATYLNEAQVKVVIKASRRYKISIRWTIANIILILPGICTPEIHLENDCNPRIVYPRRLNPPIQELVKKEIIKLLDVGCSIPFVIVTR